ncbi:MAG: hypothetical protein AB8G22_20530 [Saprospiraceae bacterium]
MRLVINLVLFALILGLIYVLIGSIREPIAFQAERAKREQAVIDKLMEIRTAQEAYRGITGLFAPTFDTLKQVLNEGKFLIINVQGDPDDPDAVITYDTTYVNASDSLASLGLNLDSLRYVPFGNGAAFNIKADTIDYQQTLVSVTEVGTPIKSYMGPFADERFVRYDAKYNPNGVRKFGDMNKPNLSGNWE